MGLYEQLDKDIKRLIDRDIAKNRYGVYAKRITPPNGKSRWSLYDERHTPLDTESVSYLLDKSQAKNYEEHATQYVVRAYETEDEAWQAACPEYTDKERKHWLLYGCVESAQLQQIAFLLHQEENP